MFVKENMTPRKFYEACVEEANKRLFSFMGIDDSVKLDNKVIKELAYYKLPDQDKKNYIFVIPEYDFFTNEAIYSDFIVAECDKNGYTYSTRKVLKSFEEAKNLLILIY